MYQGQRFMPSQMNIAQNSEAQTVSFVHNTTQHNTSHIHIRILLILTKKKKSKKLLDR
jgi:hypothetical protein